MFRKSFIPIEVIFTPIKSTYNALVSSLKTVDGRIVPSSEFQVFDIAESLKEFNSHDFSVVALNSIGALSKLKTTYMSTMSDMNIADKIADLKFESDD